MNLKGEFGGQCNCLACQNINAKWYSAAIGAYYCPNCANWMSWAGAEQLKYQPAKSKGFMRRLKSILLFALAHSKQTSAFALLAGFYLLLTSDVQLVR